MRIAWVTQRLPLLFLTKVRQVIRTKRLSRSTEQSYLHYIVHYINFHGKHHPETLGEAEVQAYLSHLALDKHVAASPQNVALAALLFLYRQVIGRELGMIDAVRAKRPQRLPVVFSRGEVGDILTALEQEPPPYGFVLYARDRRYEGVLHLHIVHLLFTLHNVPPVA